MAIEMMSTVHQHSFFKIIGILHGSSTKCTSVTMGHPGLFSNIEKPRILNWILKWNTLRPLFEAARSKDKDTITTMLKDMSYLDPMDENGFNLSDYFTRLDFATFVFTICKPLANLTLFYDDYSIPCSVGFCHREGTRDIKVLRKLASVCLCKEGYKGTSCRRCQIGYFKQGSICHRNTDEK